ncbi:MAG: MgtC/SapB family protein [Thermoguttaceae bacterium]|jgi:putative Mg2+ transporter-C (MgtC) family protein
MDALSLGQLLVRPLVAVLLAGILGWERGVRDKPAGPRTHMMVALGSATFTYVSLMLYHSLALPGEGHHADPSRVLQGIIGGIGFLGAGSIIRSAGSVQGLTTAATIWVVGAIGVASGLGHYLVAAYTTLLAFLVLTAVGQIERRLMKHGTRETSPRETEPGSRSGHQDTQRSEEDDDS